MIIQIPSTERLSFQFMSLDCIDALYEIDQDPEVMKYISGGRPNSKQEIADTLIPRLAKYANQEQGWGLWQVNTVDTNDFIGWVLVRPMDFFSDNPQWHNIELGWRFKRASWGKGYASEAAKAIADALKAHTNITHLCAIADENNIGSLRVMEKIGMQFIKKYQHHDPLVGFSDVVYYEMPVSELV